jgi:hypothetical protein
MLTGFMAEFSSADDVIAAAEKLSALGYEHLEAYTPFPVVELEPELRIRRTKIPWFVLVSGLTGVAVAYLIIWWTNAVDYPLNVGGRPLNSFVADIPIMFETGILFASGAAFFAVLLMNRLPRVYSPIFEVDGFERASIDRFFLGIRITEPKLDPKIMDELTELGAIRVRAVGFEP